MYQKCPICNGTGTSMNTFGQVLKCEVCNGTSIISELTGLPPRSPEEKELDHKQFLSNVFRISSGRQPINIREANDLSNVKEEDRPQFKGCGPMIPEPLDFDGAKLAKEKWDGFKKSRKSTSWFHIFLNI